MLDDLFYFSSDFVVCVVSTGGWSFALALFQLGVQKVHCVPLSPLAEKELGNLIREVPCTFAIEQCSVVPDKCIFVCMYFHDGLADVMVQAVLRKLHPPPIIVIMSPPRAVLDEGRFPGYSIETRTIKHRALGGLTTAKMRVYWLHQSGGSYPRPTLQSFPKRPLHRFLEPSARLSAWYRREHADRKGLSVWCPTSPEALPLPFEKQVFPDLVEIDSVYIKDGPICRPFLDKERMQVFDLRADLEPLLNQMWNWNEGFAPPLRLMVDALLSVSAWAEKHRPCVTSQPPKVAPDWGRVRPPWLVSPGAEIPGTALQRTSFFRWVWDPLDSANVTVARKVDHAGVDESLWSVGGPDARKARDCLRTFFHSIQRRRTLKEVIGWLGAQEVSAQQATINRKGVQECLERLFNATWWEWSHGSRLHFWRWPGDWQREARDGAKAYHLSTPPAKTRFNNVPIKDEWIIRKDEEKMLKLLQRGYLEEGPYRCVIPRFPIPKVCSPDIPQSEWDIRVVWDLSKNGVNKTIFTPRFFLPTPSTYLRRLEAGMFAGDFDVGEQFHNYPLHPSERVYAGALISDSLRARAKELGIPCPKFARFARLPFGWQSSPYLALRMHARILELSTSVDDPSSAFHIAQVALNLPGMPTYDPAKPRVRLLDSSGEPTALLVSFFDDGRPFARDEPRMCRALRQVTARMQWYGTQDAARKRRPISQRPGAWAGCVAYTDQGLVRKFIPQKKWDRLVRDLGWLRGYMGNFDPGQSLEDLNADLPSLGVPTIPRKRFKSFVGFLIHVAGVYDDILPYLHGFFLAENWHLDGRDQEGYKVADGANSDPEHSSDPMTLFEKVEDGALEPEELLEDQVDPSTGSHPEPFGRAAEVDDLEPVPVTQRLVRDVLALSRIFRGDTPFQVIERPVAGIHCVFYGGGDASGEGFGAKLASASDLLGSARTIQGFWCTEISEQSSNYRELRNALEAITLEAENGRIVGSEVWFATDNSTTELAFAKGRSASRALDELVLRFRELSICYNFQLKLVHIAGTRMIELGIDGLSRGEQEMGALVRGDLIPLHLTARARHDRFAIEFSGLFRAPKTRIENFDIVKPEPNLKDDPRVISGIEPHNGPGEDDVVGRVLFASPLDWFFGATGLGHYSQKASLDTWIWDLHPATALYALEELGQARLKRHSVLRGVVVVPRLLRTEWGRRFARITDVSFEIPAGSGDLWPRAMHEPLCVGLYLPLLRFKPWDWRRVPFLVPFGRALSGLFASDPAAGSDLLREFWEATFWVASLPEKLVCTLLCDRSWRRFLGVYRARRPGGGTGGTQRAEELP